MPEQPVVCMADASALTRIFANILSNAVKYSDGDLVIMLSNTGNLTFANHASGLDEISTGKLFDRFYTVENGAGSTGLGLSIARTLTEQLHGHLSARYAEGMLYLYLSFPIWLHQ